MNIKIKKLFARIMLVVMLSSYLGLFSDYLSFESNAETVSNFSTLFVDGISLSGFLPIDNLGLDIELSSYSSYWPDVNGTCYKLKGYFKVDEHGDVDNNKFRYRIEDDGIKNNNYLVNSATDNNFDFDTWEDSGNWKLDPGHLDMTNLDASETLLSRVASCFTRIHANSGIDASNMGLNILKFLNPNQVEPTGPDIDLTEIWGNDAPTDLMHIYTTHLFEGGSNSNNYDGVLVCTASPSDNMFYYFYREFRGNPDDEDGALFLFFRTNRYIDKPKTEYLQDGDEILESTDDSIIIYNLMILAQACYSSEEFVNSLLTKEYSSIADTIDFVSSFFSYENLNIGQDESGDVPDVSYTLQSEYNFYRGIDNTEDVRVSISTQGNLLHAGETILVSNDFADFGTNDSNFEIVSTEGTSQEGLDNAAALVGRELISKVALNFSGSIETASGDILNTFVNWPSDSIKLHDVKSALYYNVIDSKDDYTYVPVQYWDYYDLNTIVSTTGELNGEYNPYTRTSVYTVFEIYSDVLKDIIENSNVTAIETPEDLLGLDNPYELIRAIYAYNVSVIASNNSFSHVIIKNTNEWIYVPKRLDENIPNSVTDSADLNGVECKHIRDYLNMLTPYQRDSLATEYLLKLKSMGKQRSLNALVGYTTMVGSYSVDTSNLITTGMDPEEIFGRIEEYNADLVYSGTATNIVRHCGIMGEYVFLQNMFAREDDEDNIAFYNAELSKMIAQPFIYDTGQQNYFANLPKSIGRFGDNSSGYVQLMASDGSWNQFISMLYNVEYGFTICAFSEHGEEGGYTPGNIAEWFGLDSSDYNSDNPFLKPKENTPNAFESWLNDASNLNSWASGDLIDYDFDTDNGVSINMLRSIIELHKLCEFLDIGIGDWSETIDLYLRIYNTHEDFFRTLENNRTIYRRADSGRNTPEEPLGVFFSISESQVSDQWLKGFALSAMYTPMETNVYDASSVAFISDPTWVSEFHYKYAFYRKALYISTDNSAVVNEFVMNDKSATRVATLRDLLNYDRDIILYVDDNFYNANQVNDIISKLDYTTMRANTELEESASNPLEWISGAVSDAVNLDAPTILKTDSNIYYSQTLAESATKIGSSADLTSYLFTDAYLLSEEDILAGEDGESVFDDYEYSIKKSYGVVSAVYRDVELFNACLNAIVSDNAVFKSSKNICNVPGTTSVNWRSIYNYYMIANLSEQMKNDSASTLDLDAPIFVDIYGNILTESGLVIIPAACNATLCGSSWNPYTVGWSEYYNNGVRIEDGEFPDDVYTWLLGVEYSEEKNSEHSIMNTSEINKNNCGGYFTIDASGQYILRTTSLSSNGISAIVQWNALNKNSEVVKQLFMNDAYYTKGSNMYSNRTVNLILETLRGAPIEYIDYTREGLDGNTDISKLGIYTAYKLEELSNSLISGTNGNALGGNAVITMPNLAFIDGIEVYMLYFFKIMFAILIVALVFSLYTDSVQSKLGIKSVGKFLITCCGVILSFTLIPNLISWSYYKSNKSMLQDEVGYVMMLNYVKELDGAEVGITSVTTPESSTELYLKVGNMQLEWWDIIYDVLFDNSIKSVTELYEAQLEDNMMAHQKDVVMKADGLYIDVQDIFDSTNINYQVTTQTIRNTVDTPNDRSNQNVTDVNGNPVAVTAGNVEDTVASFACPYYVFLDQLVANVNEYNISNDVESYSYSVASNGNLMTYDIITPYLTSSEFLEEGLDVLGLYRIYGSTTNKPSYSFAFDSMSEDRMRRSYWFLDDMYQSNKADKYIEELYDYARDYIADNIDILGKVPDEVFLKVFAMQLAIEYNDIFHVGIANSIELMNIDTRDLMRFMISDKADMYKYYSYSFSRFTYEESGTIGVIFAGLLIFMMWLTSFIKPLLMIVILALLIINIVGRKLLFKKENKSVEGYLIGCACLCLCNYAYSIMLKVSMSIIDTGLGTVTALIVAILVQIVYIICLVLITIIEVKDWRNSGFNEFSNISGSISARVSETRQLIVDKFISKHNEAYRDSERSRRYVSANYDMSSVDAMIERDQEREENGNYNSD